MSANTSRTSLHMRARLCASALVAVFLTGCVPADQQGLADAIGAVLVEQALVLVSFAVDFGRQLLAAFLF